MADIKPGDASQTPPGPDSAPGLVARGVSRSYDGLAALRNVTLELHRHQVLGLLGPNGAGKSTLVNLLTGFDQPNSGTIELEGTDVTRWSPARRAQAGLGRTFQHGHVFAKLSVTENIEVAALGVGASPGTAAQRAHDLIELLGLGDKATQEAGNLAHGDERLLGVARAMAIEPRFILMDEPAAGLNDDEIGGFSEVVRSICDERNVGVLLIDHNIGLVLGVCDWIHILDQGQTLMQGTPDEVRSNDEVATAYMGRP